MAVAFAFQREVVHGGKTIKSWVKLRAALKEELVAGHSRHKLAPRASDPDNCAGSRRKQKDRVAGQASAGGSSGGEG
eukprot:584347-Alexandrium_andersonii.AAC.1